ADTVYDTLVGDTGMQLLLYTEDMWSISEGWTVAAEAEPALRGAATVVAIYLSGAVNGERVNSGEVSRLAEMASTALAAALNALGDSDAANAALAAGESETGTASSGATSAVDGALDEAAATLRSSFDVTAFQLVLLIIGAVALFGMILNLAMLVREVRK